MRNKACLRQRYEFISSRPGPARGPQAGAVPSAGAAILDSCPTGRSCRAEHPNQTEQYLPRAARPTSPGLPKGRPGRMGITRPAQAGFGREDFRAVRAEGWGDRRDGCRLYPAS